MTLAREMLLELSTQLHTNVHHTSAGVPCTGCSDDLLWTGPGETEKGMGDDAQLGHTYLYRSSWY